MHRHFSRQVTPYIATPHTNSTTSHTLNNSLRKSQISKGMTEYERDSTVLLKTQLSIASFPDEHFLTIQNNFMEKDSEFIEMKSNCEYEETSILSKFNRHEQYEVMNGDTSSLNNSTSEAANLPGGIVSPKVLQKHNNIMKVEEKSFSIVESFKPRPVSSFTHSKHDLKSVSNVICLQDENYEPDTKRSRLSMIYKYLSDNQPGSCNTEEQNSMSDIPNARLFETSAMKTEIDNPKEVSNSSESSFKSQPHAIMGHDKESFMFENLHDRSRQTSGSSLSHNAILEKKALESNSVLSEHAASDDESDTCVITVLSLKSGHC